MDKHVLCLLVAVGCAGAAASRDNATPTPPQSPAAASAPASSGTVIITLGTRGGPRPTKDRAQSSSLLVVDGSLYLIDAGDGVTQRIVQSGHDFMKVGKVFVTHAHGDHTLGLAALVGSEWMFRRREPIDVYGGGAQRLVDALLGFLAIDAEIRAAEGRPPVSDVIRAHDIAAGVVYQDANVKVTAAENAHFHFEPTSPAYGKYKSLSYRFETKTRVVVFTGDTGPSEAVTDLAKGADVMVASVLDPNDVVEQQKQSGAWSSRTAKQQEAFIRHLEEELATPEVIGQLAAKAGVKTLVMTHLAPTTNPDDDYQRYVDRAKKYYAGTIVVAKDLMRH
jgi:ribonuclease BN (tRNA processing enzyme)